MASKQDIDAQLQEIERVIATSDGLLAEEVEASCGLGLSRRTLQRRLDKLIEQGRVIKIDRGRATRYQASQQVHAETPPTADLPLPLSKAGGDVLRLVNLPLSARTPIAYNRAFLEDYRPNRTHYFSAAEKKRLHELGHTTLLRKQQGRMRYKF